MWDLFLSLKIFMHIILFSIVKALDDHLVKRKGNDEKDVEAKFLPAILINLARRFGASLVAKCRANSCRGRCPDLLCKAPKLSCCNLACKIGIGARIPRNVLDDGKHGKDDGVRWLLIFKVLLLEEIKAVAMVNPSAMVESGISFSE
ncbi:11095_t:CDS:2 [Rhizophagus irregularis]|nr:11095_t:CDS:2 [Rhizophagus irregularis]